MGFQIKVRYLQRAMKVYNHWCSLRVSERPLWIILFERFLRHRKVLRGEKPLILPLRNNDWVFKRQLDISDPLAHLFHHHPIYELIIRKSLLSVFSFHTRQLLRGRELKFVVHIGELIIREEGKLEQRLPLDHLYADLVRPFVI